MTGHSISARRLTVQASCNNPIGNSTYLDIGCGKGVLLATLGLRFRQVIGIDPSIEYLFLANRLLQELGKDDVGLLLAHAEAIPLRDDIVDLATGLDVVEHMADQSVGIHEMFRVVKPQGGVFINSPNRFSLFAPEDHVCVWWVGFIPRRYMSAYVRLFTGQDYKGVKLMSYTEVRGLVKQHSSDFVEEGIMFDPARSNLSRKETILKRVPGLLFVLNSLLKFFIPSYHFLAKKTALTVNSTGWIVDTSKSPTEEYRRGS